MKTPTLLVLASLSAAWTAPAGDVQPYRSKSRSEFTATANAHDPFWPIGYAHHEIAGAQPEQKASLELKASLFNVSSISVFGRERLAVINKKVFGVGDVVALPIGNQRVAVQVVAIQDGAVMLQYEAQRVTVPLNGPNLTKLTPAGTADTPVPAGVIPASQALPRQ